MSNLLQLLSNRGAFFLFALLEMWCLYLIVSFNDPQRVVAEATWLRYSGSIMERSDKMRTYLKLDQTNQQLREENASLLAQLPSAFYVENIERDTVQDDSLRQRYTFISAEIINKSPLSANLTYVLNRGYIHGVEPHMGVINDGGVVGIVTQVSPRHSRVMSLLHRDMRLSAGLRSKNFFGTLRWEGGDTRYAILYNIPDYSKAAVGDTIETTGYSNIFPSGVALGKVSKKEVVKGDNTLKLTVKLFNDFFNIQHGYIVRDLMKEDLEQLDNEAVE
ncbi:MAG: rod shape-determining protein MreC [Saprospiraceae bacterium]